MNNQLIMIKSGIVCVRLFVSQKQGKSLMCNKILLLGYRISIFITETLIHLCVRKVGTLFCILFYFETLVYI